MIHKPPRKCKCGHTWEDHHHGCIMNPNYPEEDHKRGICRGVLAQECEATQINGEWLVEEKDRCYCGGWELFDKALKHSDKKYGKMYEKLGGK